MNPTNTRKQSIKVIVSEAIMVLAVIATVVILALLVSGYWLNSNFEVERNGMLQISSLPTGASIEIDGEKSSWLERTNSSRILKSGSHSIVLTKDGYDSWSKTVNITEGLLYRLHYPRLFLQDRTLEKVLDASGYTNATISSDHGAMLLMNNTTSWTYLNLDSDTLTPRIIDISKLFSDVSMPEDSKIGTFTGEIMQADWDYDASHILFKVASNEKIEWVLLDINDVDKSINITKQFDAEFSRIEILDNNSNNLLAVRNQNLHKIDVPGRLISAVLVKDVIDFDHYNNEIVFAARLDSEAIQSDVGEVNQNDGNYYVGYLKLGDSKYTMLEQVSEPVRVAISKFYDAKYVTVIRAQEVSIHQKEQYEDDVAKYELTFVPSLVKVGHDGEYIILAKDNQLATIDMEANLVREWNIEDKYDWLDNDMLYTISNEELIVYDYDGLNRRAITKNVSSRFPVSIVGEKWLYYFSNSKLVREWLIKH